MRLACVFWGGGGGADALAVANIHARLQNKFQEEPSGGLGR
jgi:hypothetical protein